MNQEQNNQNLNQEQNNENMNLNVEEYQKNKEEFSEYYYDKKKCVRNMIISSINLFVLSNFVSYIFIILTEALSSNNYIIGYLFLIMHGIYVLWSFIYFIKSIVRICAKEKMKKKYDLYVYGGVFGIILLYLLAIILGSFIHRNNNEYYYNNKYGNFIIGVREIYKTSKQQWIMDSMNNNIKYKSYSKCDKGCTNSLDLSIGDYYDYYVFLDKYGNVRVLYATDGKYQYSFEGDDLKIENIKVEDCLDISKLDKNEVITISYYGKYDPNYEKRIDLFKTQIVELYKSIQQQWLMETMLETKDMVYKEYDENKTSNKFQVKYYVFVDKNGKIKKFYATNGEFQFTFKGESMMINEIDLNNIIDISKISESDIIDFSKIEE